MSDSNFYRAFEDRYRGSRALIKSRVKVYLPFLYPLKDLYPDSPILDLGCGRGEWLELLRDEDFIAHGVDQDSAMLSACTALGLSVERGDALATLCHLPDASQIVVSGFHIAEHMPFPMLQEMVKEALRVLKPAGLLILETPNIENLVVGSSSFYLYPTHQRPLPPLLLSFLTEYTGFLRNKIVRLQESPELAAGKTPVSLLQVLAGVSPDYAVVAQKKGKTNDTARIDVPFAQEYGLTLEALAARHDASLRAEITCREDNGFFTDKSPHVRSSVEASFDGGGEKNIIYGVNVIGHISGNLGLGVFARSVVSSLLKLGVKVSILDIDPGFSRWRHDIRFDHLSVSSPEKLLHSINIFLFPPETMTYVIPIMGNALRILERINVLWTMWELPKVPREWHLALQVMDLVMGGSPFVTAAIATSLDGPFFLDAAVPHILPEQKKYRREYFLLPKDKILFLAAYEPYSDPHRKNPFAAIDAFRRGVGNSQKANLIIKINSRDSYWRKDLQRFIENDPRIIIFDKLLSYNMPLNLFQLPIGQVYGPYRH